MQLTPIVFDLLLPPDQEDVDGRNANHVRSCPFLPAHIGLNRMRRSFYSDTDLHSSGHESDYEESSDDLNGGGSSNRSNQLNQRHAGDLPRGKLRRDPCARVSSPSSSDSDDEFTDLMGSSRDQAAHYDSLSSCAPLSASSAARERDSGIKSAASLRKAFFSELSSRRPETLDEQEEPKQLQQKQQQGSNQSADQDLEAAAGGEEEEADKITTSGSPSRISLLGVRRGSKGSHGGLRAVLFGSKSRSRTKSIAIDPSVTGSPFEAVLSSSASGSQKKRRLSSFQIKEESAQELTQSRSRLLPSASSSASSTPVRMSCATTPLPKQTPSADKRPIPSSPISLSSSPSGRDARRSSADERSIREKETAEARPKSQSVTLSIETDV